MTNNEGTGARSRKNQGRIRDMLSPESSLRSSVWEAPSAVFRTYSKIDDLPPKIETRAGDAWLVPDFVLCEALVHRGAESGRVAVLSDRQQEDWTASLEKAGPVDALVPPTPFDFGVKACIVLPTYNEMENLESMVGAIRKYLVSDILVVDDNSPDGTGRLADKLAEKDEALYVLHRENKEGLGKAYIAGFEWTLERDYSHVFEMDCDFSHAPWDLPRLLHAGLDADLVIGSRYVPGGCTKGWSLSRRMLSKGANFYTKFFLGFSVKDWTAGFRCYKAEMLRKLDFAEIAASGYSFQIEMAWRTKRRGGRIRELPVHFIDRDQGKSKMSKAIAIEAVRIVPWLRLKG